MESELPAKGTGLQNTPPAATRNDLQAMCTTSAPPILLLIFDGLGWVLSLRLPFHLTTAQDVERAAP